MSPVVPHFALDEEGSPEGAHVIVLRGELHVSTAPEFAQRLNAAIESGRTRVVLDMAGVEFIDSTGLSVLLNGLRLVTQMQGRMALVASNPTVLRLFDITSLNTTFAIYDDRAGAIAHVLQDGPAGEGASTSGAP